MVSLLLEVHNDTTDETSATQQHGYTYGHFTADALTNTNTVSSVKRRKT